MSAYYNEIDRYCCDWLQNLMDADLITPGKIDDRSIADLSPDDLKGYERAHFFAGIAGWELALQLAGWGSRPVWTGSCPCQPFSAAGKGKASGDERHLWPVWAELIRTCRPPAIFGEQVEAAIGWGWLDLVHSDLEAEGYTVGAAVLPACGVGAPHIRQRLWFVGNAKNVGHTSRQNTGRKRETTEQRRSFRDQLIRPSDLGELGNASGEPSEWRTRSVLGTEASEHSARFANGHESDRFADASKTSELAYANKQGSQGRRKRGNGATKCSPWESSVVVWLPCADGKQRPTQSGIFPLAHGISGRVAKLRAAGNAIVPQVAAEFIKATM